jgi:hypothetical protein
LSAAIDTRPNMACGRAGCSKRGPMIYSGASEIQRNILGERVPGLRKD